MAYAQLEPFGTRRDDFRAAMLAIATLAPHRKRYAKRIKPGDVFPELAEDEAADKYRQRTPGELLDRLSQSLAGIPKTITPQNIRDVQ